MKHRAQYFFSVPMEYEGNGPNSDGRTTKPGEADKHGCSMSRRSQRRDGLPGVQSWAQTDALDAGPKVGRCTVVPVPMGTFGR